MKEKNIRVFDSEDHEFVKCLRNIGIERKLAMVLAFFRVEEIGTSRGIEMATSLRQPEVSLAIVALRNLDFINSEQLTIPGKKRGQYTNEYSLAVPLEDIIKHFWGIALQRWGEKMDAYKKLLDYEIRPFSG